MWKIKNNYNKEILDKFKDNIILPLFEFLIEMSINKTSIITDIDSIKKTNVYKTFSQEQKNVFNFMINAEYSTKTSIKQTYKFYELVNDIVNKCNLRDIKMYKDTFIFQNNQVDAGCLCLKEVKVCKELSIIFSKFFYESFFDEYKVWQNLINKNYNREIFHTFFDKENKYISVCPYCDIDTIIDKDNRKIEHFLPRKKFPFLSMSAMNLIPACGACNTKKSTNVYNIIANPYKEQVGNSLKFVLDTTNQSINIDIINSDLAYANYVSLFKLKQRYGKYSIYNYVYNEVSIFFNSIMMEEVTETEIANYIKMNGKKRPLIFATTDAIKEEYKEFRKVHPYK